MSFEEEETWTVEQWALFTRRWSKDAKEFAQKTLNSSPEKRAALIPHLEKMRDEAKAQNDRDFTQLLIDMCQLSTAALTRLVQSFTLPPTSEVDNHSS